MYYTSVTLMYFSIYTFVYAVGIYPLPSYLLYKAVILFLLIYLKKWQNKSLSACIFLQHLIESSVAFLYLYKLYDNMLLLLSYNTFFCKSTHSRLLNVFCSPIIFFNYCSYSHTQAIKDFITLLCVFLYCPMPIQTNLSMTCLLWQQSLMSCNSFADNNGITALCMKDLNCIIIGIYLPKLPITDACTDKQLFKFNMRFNLNCRCVV